MLKNNYEESSNDAILRRIVVLYNGASREASVLFLVGKNEYEWWVFRGEFFRNKGTIE